MNWYCKNIETLLIIATVIFMFLMVVDVIIGRTRGIAEGKWPLCVGLGLSLICLLGLIITLPVWFEAPKMFAVIISPGSLSTWLGWVYAAKTVIAFLLLTPLFSILGIVFSARAFLPHTWIF